jgi:hypothetical protein
VRDTGFVTDAGKLRYVDPHRRRGRVYLAIARLSSTKLGEWLSVNVFWRLDPLLLRLTGGRLSSTGPLAAALLESRGARTGLPRQNATLYFHDGETAYPDLPVARARARVGAAAELNG